jgi:hypothetical protein
MFVRQKLLEAIKMKKVVEAFEVLGEFGGWKHVKTTPRILYFTHVGNNERCIMISKNNIDTQTNLVYDGRNFSEDDIQECLVYSPDHPSVKLFESLMDCF